MKSKLLIQNLKCGGCENTIVNKISSIKGVGEVAVNHQEASVAFKYSSPETLLVVKETLSKLGYPILGEKNHLGKKAKSYVSCAIGRMQK